MLVNLSLPLKPFRVSQKSRVMTAALSRVAAKIPLFSGPSDNLPPLFPTTESCAMLRKAGLSLNVKSIWLLPSARHILWKRMALSFFLSLCRCPTVMLLLPPQPYQLLTLNVKSRDLFPLPFIIMLGKGMALSFFLSLCLYQTVLLFLKPYPHQLLFLKVKPLRLLPSVSYII